jgi:hypothetical protein
MAIRDDNTYLAGTVWGLMSAGGRIDRQSDWRTNRLPFEIQQRLSTDSELPTIRLENKEGSVNTDYRALGRCKIRRCGRCQDSIAGERGTAAAIAEQRRAEQRTEEGCVEAGCIGNIRNVNNGSTDHITM